MMDYITGMIYDEECGHCKASELVIDADNIYIKFYEHGMDMQAMEQLSNDEEVGIQLHDMGTFLLFEVKTGDKEEDIFWGACENTSHEITLNTDCYKVCLLLFDTFTGELCAKKQVMLGAEQSSYLSKAISYQLEHPIDVSRLTTLKRTAEMFYNIKKNCKSKGE